MTGASTELEPSNRPSKRGLYLLAVLVLVVAIAFFLALSIFGGTEAPEQRYIDLLNISSCIQPSKDLVEKSLEQGQAIAKSEISAIVLNAPHCSLLIRSATLDPNGVIKMSAQIARKGQTQSASVTRSDVQLGLYPMRTSQSKIEWQFSCSPKDTFSKVLCKHE